MPYELILHASTNHLFPAGPSERQQNSAESSSNHNQTHPSCMRGPKNDVATSESVDEVIGPEDEREGQSHFSLAWAPSPKEAALLHFAQAAQAGLTYNYVWGLLPGLRCRCLERNSRKTLTAWLTSFVGFGMWTVAAVATDGNPTLHMFPVLLVHQRMTRGGQFLGLHVTFVSEAIPEALHQERDVHNFQMSR